MTTSNMFATRETKPASKAPLRAARLLIGGYVALSVLTVAAVITLSRLAPHQANPQAWVRSIFVAATSLLTLRFVVLAAQGKPRALLRLRIVVSILVVAVIAVLFFVPLPLWMVMEQCVCGLLLAGTAVVIFRRDAPQGR
jgi:presenilin-like A22 family membrane protease